jgi:hypothetical protein
MSISEIGDRLVLTDSVEGNVFPKSERETLFPLTIKAETGPIRIEGSLYARSLDIGSGNITVHGPIASRGDIIVSPGKGNFRALGGITTLSGLVIGERIVSRRQLVDDLKECRSIVRGDIVSNQSVLLNDTVVFGSINAVNCTVINSVVLGTIYCQDHLSIEMSSIGGYLSRGASFRGMCTLFNAIGESIDKPQFLTYEDLDNSFIDSSIHFYPALRAQAGMRLSRDHVADMTMSILYPDVDWVAINAEPDPRSSVQTPSERWVLSIGSRIADFTKIDEASFSLSEMLRVGFEFSHYEPEVKHSQLELILHLLTPSEASILQAVCS